MPPLTAEADPRRHAARVALDRLVPTAAAGTADDVEIRDGGALLVRRASVLVRVRPDADADVAAHEVGLARLLAGVHVPVTSLVEGDGQPWEVEGCAVSAWRWVEQANAPSSYELGLVARTLRDRSAVAAGLVATLDPLRAVRRAVAPLGPDDADAAFLRRRADELDEPYAGAVAGDPLGRSVVHGDLHRDNVVWGAPGPLLTDLELAGAGPPSYDAAPAVVAARRYGGSSAELDDFLRGFGVDPRPWPGFAVLVQVYELWVTAWAVGNRHRDPSWGEEAARRVATLRDGADHRWSLR